MGKNNTRTQNTNKQSSTSRASRRKATRNNMTQTIRLAESNVLQAGGGMGAVPRRSPRGSQPLGYPVSIPGAVELTYNALGSTDEGREFALVNLHPCGEYVTEAPGIPDESQASSVTPVFRGDSVVSIDPAYFVTPPTLPAEFRYDIQLAVLPIPEIDYVFRVRVPSLNTGWSRWVVRRTTYFANNPDGSAVTLLTSGYTSSRMIGRGITVHFDAPQLADQGRLIAGQVKAPSKLVPIELTNTNPVTNSSPINCYTIYVPDSETELMQQDPLAAQWEAKCGTYIPHRYIQPQQFYSPTVGGAPQIVDYTPPGSETPVVGGRVPSSLLVMASGPESIDFASGNPVYHEQTPTWPAEPAVQPPQGIPLPGFCDWGISEPLNHFTSVQFFLGIQNTAQLHVKTRLYLENEAHARQSPVTPFLHKSPTLDIKAMHLVAMVAQNQQHVFFASDNDLSTILASIGRILPGLLGALEHSGLPVVSTVGGLGGLLGRGLKSFVSSF